MQKKLPLINSAHGSDTRNIINELIKLFNGMGYTYNESLQKAHDVLNEAERVNKENVSTQKQVDELILHAGQSDAEVIQARGGLPLLKDRLDESDAQLADISTNVKNFGAKGDGSTDDTQSIQAAINFVVDNGGGTVYLPPGRYVTSETIELYSNVELSGSGMYNTIFFPNYLGVDAYQNIIQAVGSSENRMKDIIVRDIGIDGSNVEYTEPSDRGLDPGQWVRIQPRNVDNFKAYNIYYSHGSHLFHMHGCRNFSIENIRVDYSFSAVHMIGDNKEGIINNINATRVACIVDWGAGGEDIIVSNVFGDGEGYVRQNEEAFDMGGAKNIKISNVIAKNFERGANIKGEGGISWDNINFDNCTFEGFLKDGIRATVGDTSESGFLKLSNCTFQSDVTEGGYYAIEAIAGRLSVDLDNVKIDVNERGTRFYNFSELNIKNLTIKSKDRGLYIEAPGETVNGKCVINKVYVNSEDSPIYINRCEPFVLLDTFTIHGGSLTGIALDILNTTKPILRNGLISDINSHAIRLSFRDYNIAQPNELNGLLAELTNITIRNWGLNSTYRNGMLFSVPSNLDGSFKGLRLRDLSFEITGERNLQNGISWGGFSDNTIDYSWFDGITFYNVNSEQSSTGAKGSNNVERIMSIK